MKAIVITEPGGPEVLEMKDLPEPEPTADQLLLRVRATALNRADLLQRRGLYPPPAGVRTDIPGLEVAGVVRETGTECRRFQAGDRVMGLLAGEGYSQLVALPESLALRIPAHLSCQEAAAVPEAFLTAYDALFERLKLKQNESTLIHACGSGVGSAAVQLARSVGARIFATAGSAEKLSKAAELGVDVQINYRETDFSEVIKNETGGAGVDAILDFVGAPYWERNLASLATLGRLVLVGTLGGSKVETDLRTLMFNRLTVVGTVLRRRTLQEKATLTRAFAEKLLPLFEKKLLQPVVDSVFPWQQVQEAHRHMESNKNFGKIVLSVE